MGTLANEPKAEGHAYKQLLSLWAGPTFES